MYKIHSKLVFFFKLTHLKKKKSPHGASEQCKRIALFTILNMNSAIFLHCSWTVQLTWTVQKKHGIDALQILRFQRRKKMGSNEQYTIILFNQTAATVF